MKRSIKVQLADKHKILEKTLQELALEAVRLTDHKRNTVIERIRKAQLHLLDAQNTLKSAIEELTDSELKVQELILHGFSNPQIAEHLCISLKTVKFHITNIYKKLGVRNRSAMIVEHYQDKQKPSPVVQMNRVMQMIKPETVPAPVASLPQGKAK